MSGRVLGSTDQAVSITGTIFSRFTILSAVDIIIVAALFYWILLLIRETRAIPIIYGIIFLSIIWLLAKYLQLNTLSFILQNTLTVIIVAIPIVFQPELRNALVKLGRTKIKSSFKELQKKDFEQVISIISETSQILSKQKTGALIVLSRGDSLKEHLENGKLLDARISVELLLNIFTPKTPLHDGAVIISGSKIKAAGAILPLSENKFDYKLGTRHRAAIGLSSISDAAIIIISEETGSISLAVEGIFESDLKLEELSFRLKQLLK